MSVFPFDQAVLCKLVNDPVQMPVACSNKIGGVGQVDRTQLAGKVRIGFIIGDGQQITG
ncbi:hypothetical protein D3C75_1244800 [compost metagenome]